jgi:hypothetical protein
MKKSSSLVLSLALSVAGTIPASAENFYIPSPEIGGGNPKIHLEVSNDGPRKLEIAFVETGHSAVGVNGSRVSVDNDEKPNVFNTTRYVDGPGLVRVTNDPGPNVRSGSLFLSNQINDLAWPVPIVTNDNWFNKNETAYLQNMARSAKGHANIEIMNFGTQAAACSIQLRRPKGSPFGAPTTVTLLPVSHEVVEDPFKDLVTSGGGLRAEVECDQPFYAFGTFVGPNLANFRMHYPLETPPVDVVETLNVIKNGVFFVPEVGNSALDVALPLVPERAYRKVTIDFDVFVTRFTPIFTGLVGMLHAGGPRFGKTLYFGTFVRGARSKTLVDLGSPVVEPALRIASPWKENTMHHVTLVYDTEGATTQMKVTQGTKTVMDAFGGAYNLDVADRGAPVRVSFGLAGVADNAYFPPIGWRFQNLKIKIER